MWTLHVSRNIFRYFLCLNLNMFNGSVPILMLGTFPVASCQVFIVSSDNLPGDNFTMKKLPCDTLPCNKVDMWPFPGKMIKEQNGQLAKWSTGKMINWQKDQLANWSTGKIVNWRNGQPAKWSNGNFVIFFSANWQTFAYWQLCLMVKCQLTNCCLAT